MEVLAEMVTKAPTRVAIVEPCLGEPKDFEVLTLILWDPDSCEEIQVYKEIYENVVQVGSGTFGSVYFVRDRETGDGAAAKYLRQVTFLVTFFGSLLGTAAKYLRQVKFLATHF